MALISFLSYPFLTKRFFLKNRVNTKLHLTCSSFFLRVPGILQMNDFVRNMLFFFYCCINCLKLFKKYVYQIVLNFLKEMWFYCVLSESEDEVEEEQEERQPSPEPVQENANSGYYEAHPVT